jgi:hypothetical protein
MGAESSKTAGPLVLKPDDLTAHEAPATYTDGDLVDQEEGGWSEEQGDPRAVVVVPAILMTIYERVKLQLPDGSSTEPLWCLQNRTGNYTRMTGLDLTQGLQDDLIPVGLLK